MAQTKRERYLQKRVRLLEEENRELEERSYKRLAETIYQEENLKRELEIEGSDHLSDEVMNKYDELMKAGKYMTAASLILGLIDVDGNETGKIFDFSLGRVVDPPQKGTE